MGVVEAATDKNRAAGDDGEQLQGQDHSPGDATLHVEKTQPRIDLGIRHCGHSTEGPSYL